MLASIVRVGHGEMREQTGRQAAEGGAPKMTENEGVRKTEVDSTTRGPLAATRKERESGEDDNVDLCRPY